MITERVLQYAHQNTWADIYADDPIHLKPGKATGAVGEQISINLRYNRLQLPNNVDRFHVYQLGTYHTDSLYFTGLNRRKWMSLKDIVTNHPVYFTGYFDDGTMVHHQDVYLIITEDNALVLAVKDNDVYKASQKQFFVEFKRNAYYTNADINDDIYTVSDGKLISNQSELVSLRQDILNYEQRPGKTLVFADGTLRVNNQILGLNIGSNVSYVYDSSIKKIEKFKLADLDTYTSALDSGKKYLLHPKKTEDTDDVLDYVDDVDFYLINEVTGKGILIYKQLAKDARSITHKDWGLDYTRVQTLLDINVDVNNYSIYAYIRHSGLDKKLTLSEQKIHELYKLDDEQIYNSLINHNHLFNMWTATALEVSDFLEITRNDKKMIKKEDVLIGYGYNALTKYMGVNTLAITRNSVTLPDFLNENVTVVEYTDVGNFIGYYYHISGNSYIPNNEYCKYIAVFYGKPNSQYKTYTSDEDFTISPYHDVRVFDCPIVNGIPTKQWTEITGDASKYIIVDGKVIWNIDLDGRLGLVVTNQYLKIFNDVKLESDGIIEIDIDDDNNLVPEKTEVYLNEKHLTEDIDYVRKGNEIVLTNTSYITKTDMRFCILCRGVKASTTKHEIKTKSGFVVDGRVSTDQIYDLKDDKVMFCHIDGRLKLQDKIAWEEDTGNGFVNEVMNGKTYSLSESMVAIPGLVSYDAYPRRDISKENDKKISDLFTFLEMYRQEDLDWVHTDYIVHSPFLSYIINDLSKGLREPLDSDDDDVKLEEWISRYFKYLDYDPCRLFSNQQMQFVKIVPYIHKSISLDVKSYGFCERIIKEYLNNRIILSDSVTIKLDED